MGSSPRVRGAGRACRHAAEHAGIIPACAGSRPCGRGASGCAWDHPRVCGEQVPPSLDVQARKGSSPRVRGAALPECSRRTCPRIIPACAGSSRRTTCSRRRLGDHPRVCGEQRRMTPAVAGCTGSSPRVRGAAGTIAQKSTSRGIIPACAGSRPRGARRRRPPRDHPRVCGEQEELYAFCRRQGGSSPRVRGAADGGGVVLVAAGIIPACAGSSGP